MNEEELDEYLEKNLTISIDKSRSWTCDTTIVRVKLKGKTIAEGRMFTSKQTGLQY